MAAKTIEVRREPTDPWLSLPGSTGELSEEAATTDDSIFGSNFTSFQSTLISWTITANGYFKGFPGYRATIKRAGSPTAISGEATTATNGGYYITNRARSLLDRNTPVVVYDGGSQVDAENIEYIDYLQGGVVFVQGYVPTGAVTMDASYMATTPMCFAQSFSLTMSADTENVTDFCTAQDNDGYAVYKYQRQTVELSLDGFYNPNAQFSADLIGRDTVIIEINPDGQEQAVARGYFQATSTSQSGDVGNTEAQSATYSLAVPEGVAKPFSWYHAANSSLPAAIRVVLDAWENREEIGIRYTPENGVARTGKALVSDTSLESEVEGINTFNFTFQGTDQLAGI